MASLAALRALARRIGIAHRLRAAASA